MSHGTQNALDYIQTHLTEQLSYEALQKQRRLETTMRAQRQEIKLLQDGGADEDDVIAARCRYRATSGQYTRFSDAMDLPQQRERVTVDGLGNIGVGKYKKNPSVNRKQVKIDITDNGKYEKLPYTYEQWAEYQKHIRPEYYAQRITRADNNVLWSGECGYIQNGVGCKNINKYKRGLESDIDPKYKNTIDILDRRTSAPSLKHDYVGFRKVDASYLNTVMGIDTSDKTIIKKCKTRLDGNRWIEVPKDAKSAQSIVDSINDLVGTDRGMLLDSGYTSISLAEDINYFTHMPIQFEIQMPAGTRGIITDNWKESEFITQTGTTLDILGAEVYNDGEKDCIRIWSRLIQD